MALTGGGGVWECGRKDYGQLGHGDRTGKHLFARVGPGHFGEPASSWRPAGCPYFMMPGDLVKRVVEVCRWGEAKSFGEGVLRLMGAERSCRRSRHKQPYSDQPRFRWTLNRRTATAYSGFPLRLCPWKSWPRPFSHVILQDRVSVVAERREESGRSRRVTETWHGQAAASNSFESPEPPPIIWVAHVSSGHLCEYLASDLVFADSSSFDTLPSKPAPQTASKKAQKIVVGSKVPRQRSVRAVLEAPFPYAVVLERQRPASLISLCRCLRAAASCLSDLVAHRPSLARVCRGALSRSTV